MPEKNEFQQWVYNLMVLRILKAVRAQISKELKSLMHTSKSLQEILSENTDIIVKEFFGEQGQHISYNPKLMESIGF